MVFCNRNRIPIGDFVLCLPVIRWVKYTTGYALQFEPPAPFLVLGVDNFQNVTIC